MNVTTRRRLTDEDGQVAIELALVLPVLIMFIFLVADFGRAFNYVNDTNQIAAQGARMAAVDDYPGGAALAAEGDTTELRDGGDQVPEKLSVCVSFPDGTNVGDPVTVTATAKFKLVPLIGGIEIPIHGHATMRLERTPSFAAGC